MKTIKSKQAILSVTDMHCPSCPKLITLGLKDQKGVTSVAASLENKQVVIKFDPSKVKITDLVANIKESGYTAVPQQNSSAKPLGNGRSEIIVTPVITSNAQVVLLSLSGMH